MVETNYTLHLRPSGFAFVIRKGWVTFACMACLAETKQMAYDLAVLFPELPFIGWDIGQSIDGPIAIEGNSTWGSPNYPDAMKSIASAMADY